MILNGPYNLKIHSMGLVDANNHVNFYDGKVRVVDTERKEKYKYHPIDYRDYVAERVEPWSILNFPTCARSAGMDLLKVIIQESIMPPRLEGLMQPTEWRRHWPMRPTRNYSVPAEVSLYMQHLPCIGLVSWNYCILRNDLIS